MLIPILLTLSLLLGRIVSDTCHYPSSGDTTRTFDRLQADQETALIPKICENADGCGNSNAQSDVCARDPEILSNDVGCTWCTSKDPHSCNPTPSNITTDDDYYNCYSTTPESCGCVDNRGGHVAVLVDVTGQTADSFNYYLLYFSWWFSEKILPQTDKTYIHYIFFTDEIVYAGNNPYDYWGFQVDDSPQPQPIAMAELPDELKNKTQPNLCEALSEAMHWFDTQNDLMPTLIYYIPYTSVNDAALQDCRDVYNEQLLDGITTFALRFWSDTDLSLVEEEYGSIEWCEYFQKPTYTPSQGNSPDTRYFVNTLSEFICASGGTLTLDPTQEPTQNPTTLEPTNDPTVNPTETPTGNPTQVPTSSPTIDPTVPPTSIPTKDPTENPSIEPTKSPTFPPTSDPTNNPTQNPTTVPTEAPTADPTKNPSANPTSSPTTEPTLEPTEDPTKQPTPNETDQPTQNPTKKPTEDPTEQPTANPTGQPTEWPSYQPTEHPTPEPTYWWNGQKKDKKPCWENRRTSEQPKWWGQKQENPWWNAKRHPPKGWIDHDNDWWGDHNDDSHHNWRRWSDSSDWKKWSDSSDSSSDWHREREWRHHHREHRYY